MFNLPQNQQLHQYSLIHSCLRMPLKSKWFEMTKAGIKTEDYREINKYWSKRFYTKDSIEHIEECFENNGGCIHLDYLDFKKFDCNIVTLGYPKSTDSERILKLEHKGIKIDYGNPDWGAEPNKLYFVIMHGAILKLGR